MSGRQQDKQIVPLLEFIYDITSSWTQSFEKYRDFDDEENRSALILYECIYFFLYIIKRLSYNKFDKEKAEQIHSLINMLIITGIVNLMTADSSDQERDKLKLDFFAKSELAELEYMKGNQKTDMLTDSSVPIITKFRRRVAIAANHENDNITPKINILTETLYREFLLEKLVYLEDLISKTAAVI